MRRRCLGGRWVLGLGEGLRSLRGVVSCEARDSAPSGRTPVARTMPNTRETSAPRGARLGGLRVFFIGLEERWPNIRLVRKTNMPCNAKDKKRQSRKNQQPKNSKPQTTPTTPTPPRTPRTLRLLRPPLVPHCALCLLAPASPASRGVAAARARASQPSAPPPAMLPVSPPAPPPAPTLRRRGERIDGEATAKRRRSDGEATAKRRAKRRFSLSN